LQEVAAEQVVVVALQPEPFVAALGGGAVQFVDALQTPTWLGAHGSTVPAAQLQLTSQAPLQVALVSPLS
jgi:hypothetical protein